MQELKVLFQLITFSPNLKNLFLFGPDSESKETALLENVKAGNYTTDAEAASALYGSSPNDVRYKMLKQRLKKKLYNNLLFTDISKFRSEVYYQKEIECLMLLQQAQVLLRHKDLDLVLVQANRVLKISEHYEFTNTTLAAYELIAFCYSELGEYRKFMEVKAKLDLYLQKKRYEREAMTINQEIKVNSKRHIKDRKEYLDTLPQAIRKLHKLWQLSQTFDTFNAYYKASMSYYELEGRFLEIVKLTVLSEQWAKDKKINPIRFESLYNKYMLVYAHLRAKQYKDGLKYADEFSPEFDTRSLNWFAYSENYFLLALHSREYALADNILARIKQNTAFDKLSKASKERWLLFELYKGLFVTDEKKQVDISRNPVFIDMPQYSKDKQGYNVAILTLQFIYYMIRRDKEALVYRIANLKKYKNTHLNDSFSQRSKLFIKLLILIVKENFVVAACRSKGKKLYEKLQETPTPGDAYADIEIVPYEHLWEQILVILEQKKSKS